MNLGGWSEVINTSPVPEILPIPATLRRHSDLYVEWDEGDKFIIFFLLLQESLGDLEENGRISKYFNDNMIRNNIFVT